MDKKISKHYSSILCAGTYDIKKGLTLNEIEEIANDKDLSVIVFENLTKMDFQNLEKYIFSKNPTVLLSKTSRHLFPEPLDLNFLSYLPSLKRLRICAATQLINFDNYELLGGLEELTFYRFEAELIYILKKIPPNLKKISFETPLSSKKVNIDFIARFSKLQYLHIEGSCKGIEEIGKLYNLEKLVFRSVSLPNLDFIKDLNKLWYIDIKLGGIKDFGVLSKLPQIKYLELWLIKGLKDISFIEEMKELQFLHLESLINIEALPSFDKLKKLRRIKLMTLNGLKNFDSLKTVPNLQDFFYAGISKQQPNDLIPLLENPSMKNVYVYFYSEKKNKEFDALIKKHNKTISDWPDFRYE